MADRLVHSLMAMSLLLVGSTLLLTLYFRLPQALYGAGEAAAAGGAEYVDFANVVSVFWGIVMTLALVAVYAPHAVALRSHAPVPFGELCSREPRAAALYSGRVSCLILVTRCRTAICMQVAIADSLVHYHFPGGNTADHPSHSRTAPDRAPVRTNGCSPPER